MRSPPFALRIEWGAQVSQRKVVPWDMMYAAASPIKGNESRIINNFVATWQSLELYINFCEIHVLVYLRLKIFLFILQSNLSTNLMILNIGNYFLLKYFNKTDLGQYILDFIGISDRIALLNINIPNYKNNHV